MLASTLEVVSEPTLQIPRHDMLCAIHARFVAGIGKIAVI
jgi:hypothetical protein